MVSQEKKKIQVILQQECQSQMGVSRVGFICTMGFKLRGDGWDCLIVRLQGQKESLAPSSSCLVRGLKPFSKTQPFIHIVPHRLRKRLLQMLGGMTVQWK